MKSAHPIELALVLGLAVLEAVRVLVVAFVALVLVLAAAWRHRPTPTPPAACSAGAASLAAIAAELRQLPAARLRELAGTRRRCSKDRLIAELLALPV